MTVTVVGMGKIGLPLALQFASRGLNVIGADINPEVVDLINRGVEPFPGEAELGDRLQAAIASGAFSATTDTAKAVAASDTVVIVVPLLTDADGSPDFRHLDAATEAVAGSLQPGSLVTYETTLPVGTTRQRFVPLLESRSGLRLGESLFVAFSPERVFSGRVFLDLRRYPKLVGGVEPASAERALQFYAAGLDFEPRTDLPKPNGVWDLGTAEAAELAKLAETTYRDVNIALANEFARFADQHAIDVYGVIEACNSQGFSHIHQPGIAVGGHCIPVYPRLYMWRDQQTTVVPTARQANEDMPAYGVGRLATAHGELDGQTVAVLGLAFRGGVKETALSGVFPLVQLLQARGANVLVHDPLYSDEEIRGFGFAPYHLGEPVAAAIVQADHPEYRDLRPADLPGIRTLLDGRNITNPHSWTDARRLVIGVGEAKGAE